MLRPNLLGFSIVKRSHGKQASPTVDPMKNKQKTETHRKDTIKQLVTSFDNINFIFSCLNNRNQALQETYEYLFHPKNVSFALHRVKVGPEKTSKFSQDL